MEISQMVPIKFPDGEHFLTGVITLPCSIQKEKSFANSSTGWAIYMDTPKTKVGFKMADLKMATMVTTHLEKFPPLHILMFHKQEVNITNHSHFIKVYPYKWPTRVDPYKRPTQVDPYKWPTLYFNYWLEEKQEYRESSDIWAPHQEILCPVHTTGFSIGINSNVFSDGIPLKLSWIHTVTPNSNQKDNTMTSREKRSSMLLSMC